VATSPAMYGKLVRQMVTEVGVPALCVKRSTNIYLKRPLNW